MEEWENIEGYEGYLVSSLGQIKSINYNNTLKSNLLKFSLNYQNYFVLKIFNKNLRVHRIVAETFIPNPENKKTVNHKNGIKIDNRACNLEWATNSENMIHAYANGLRDNAILNLIKRNKTLPRINGRLSKFG